MNLAGIAYKYICRRPITALAVLLLTLFCFAATDGVQKKSRFAAIPRSAAGIEHVSRHAPDDVEVVRTTSPRHRHTFNRGKLKAKLFLKKYFSLSSWVAQYHVTPAGVHFASAIHSGLKPAYYSFLFRYKPF